MGANERVPDEISWFQVCLKCRVEPYSTIPVEKLCVTLHVYTVYTTVRMVHFAVQL